MMEYALYIFVFCRFCNFSSGSKNKRFVDLLVEDHVVIVQKRIINLHTLLKC